MKTTVYNLCTNKHLEYSNCSAEVYRRYGEIFHQYLISTVLPELLDESRLTPDKGNEMLLKEFVHRWQNHEVMTYWLEKFFLYLEQWYTKHAFVPKLRQVSLQQFKNIVYGDIKVPTTTALLSLIEEDRKGQNVDKILLKNVVGVYEIMGIDSLDAYCSDFENPLLESTREYYADLHCEWMQEFSKSNYLLLAEFAVRREQQLVSDYLNQSSKPKIFEILREELLDTVKVKFFNVNCHVLREMIAQNKYDDLGRLFNLYSESNECLALLVGAYKGFIGAVGNKCILKRILTAFYNKCLILAEESFCGHASFFNVFLEYFLERTTNEDATRLIIAFMGI